MNDFRMDDGMKELATRLLKYCSAPELDCIRKANPNIAYIVSSQKKKSHGMPVFGECEKVKPKMKMFAGYDYVITFYEENVEDMTPNQLEVLMLHELMHIDCMRNDDGEIKAKIMPHDIQDFHSIVDRFGTWWAFDPECKGVLGDLEEDSE